MRLKDLQPELEKGKSITCPELRYQFITFYNGAYAAHMNSSIGPIWFPMINFTEGEMNSRKWVVLK